MASKTKARVRFTILRRGNPERVVTVSGSSVKDALRFGKRLLSSKGVGPAKKKKVSRRRKPSGRSAGRKR